MVRSFLLPLDGNPNEKDPLLRASTIRDPRDERSKSDVEKGARIHPDREEAFVERTSRANRSCLSSLFVVEEFSNETNESFRKPLHADGESQFRCFQDLYGIGYEQTSNVILEERRSCAFQVCLHGSTIRGSRRKPDPREFGGDRNGFGSSPPEWLI